jgi:PAS domain S-box-containing protein
MRARLLAARASDALAPVFLLFFGAVPVAFLLGFLRARLARSAVADLVLEVGAGTPLRDALATALGDPTLQVAYRLEQPQRYVDADGRTIDLPEDDPERAITLVERDGKLVAALIHDSALREQAGLVEAVGAAAGMSLQNERLRTELQEQYRLLETIVDTAPSLLCNVDLQGRIVNLNRAVAEATGDEEEALRYRYFWDVFIDPDEREAMKRRFAEAAPDFPPAEYENVFTNARGEQLVIAWQSAPVRDESGVVVSIVAGGIDITERHHHAEELERERAFLNAIANNAPSLLCLVDLDGRVVDQATNIAFEQLLEYDPTETGGHLFWERYVDPEEADAVQKEIERVVAGGSPIEHDNHWVTRTGRRLLVAWSCTPLPRIDERTLFLISGVDVTERQRREVELRTSEARIRAAIDSSPVAIVEIDLDERITAWNPAAERIFGWTSEEVLDLPVPFVPPEKKHEFEELSERARAGEVISGHETLRARKDGSLINVAIAAAPLRDPDGEVVAYMALYADISMRKRRELELEHERDFLSTTANSIPSLLAVLDDQGLVTERGINRAFTRVMGYEEEELVGRSLWRIVGSPGDRASLVAVWREAVDRGAPHGAENRWVTKDGVTRLVEWTSIPVIDARLGQCYLISASDVTERKQQEVEIRASRARLIEAEEATRQRLERNLHDGAQQRLVALSVSLRLAEARLETSPDDTAAILAKSREELGHALDELRELARGIHPAVLTDRGLGAAVESLVARAPIPVEVNGVADHLPANVEAAAYYVVSEALTNVAKYADASVARVSISQSNGRVVIDVDDDGVGGADPALGSGLRGLADRLAALDGSLSVASPIGGGTRIRAEIPLPTE